MSEEEEQDAINEIEKQERFNILDNLTAQEKEELRDILSTGEQKHNIHTFLNEVLKTKDTTKVGFLTEAELGLPNNPIRVYKEMALISSKICNNDLFEQYYLHEAENTLATSLSREGKLINLAVMQKKVIEDATKQRKPSSSWFKKKEPEQTKME